MNAHAKTRAKPIPLRMIAPCGMDCALCIGRLREKNRCPGCNHRAEAIAAGTCRRCTIKLCDKQGRPNRFCFTCAQYPCRRLRDLDRRYRNKYGMSMLDNLGFIQEFGLRKFAAREQKKWACPACGQTLCVHRGECLRCGRPRR